MVKIYTKTGDKGMTKLVGGTMVSKASDRVAAYGTVDELNSWVGFILASIGYGHSNIRDELEAIQNFLFDCGTDLSTPIQADRPLKMKEENVRWLEEKIDAYVAKTKPIERFILPGGTIFSAQLHVARTQARRVERLIVQLSWEAKINPEVIRFMNRLSDYFFVLARYANEMENVADIAYKRSELVFHNS